MYYILKRHKAIPASALEWKLGFEKANRIVKKTDLGTRGIVSTTFLGFDHRFFETLVFDGPLDGEQWRYLTWDKAVAGHNAAVKKVKDSPHG